MRKVLILLAMVLILPVISFAYDYEIESYDVNIVVNENNEFDITEKIGALFNVDKHGIFRKLPLRNTVERLDGTLSKNSAIVSNVNVNEPFSLSEENNYQVIKIGDANRTIKGKKDYIISYSYNIGNDTGKDYDELYFNIIGNEWDTTIKNVSFNITMPKEFDKEKVGFTAGSAGSTKNNGVNYSIDGNTIAGNYAGILNPGQGLTIRIELPEGYFLVTKNPLDRIPFIVPIFFTLIVIALWYKFGRNEKPIETVEFYPPEGLNSAEIGYLYKGKVEDKDIVSLLIYLANKGYLKILEIEQSGLLAGEKTFKIVKLKEYDGDNDIERTFFNGLFETKKNNSYSFMKREKDNTVSLNKRDCVYESELEDSFYMVINKIETIIEEWKKKVFDKNASIAKIVSIIILVSTSLFVTGPLASEESLKLKFIASRRAFARVPGNLINKEFNYYSPYNPDYIKIFIFGIICIVIMGVFTAIMDKRTNYGTKVLGRINGFKNFLETAEKEKLESLVMENPMYFYDILPYTYALGVSDKWVNKFESIAYEAPSWYEGNNTFTIMAFGSFMNNTMKSANSVMTSQPSSNGSSMGGSSGGGAGGRSGGGSSGRGSGGGGGGSW